MTHIDDRVVRLDAEELRRLYPRLRRLAAVVAPAEVGPDDVVQEALTRFLAANSADVQDLEAYLRRIVVRVAANHRRGLGRRRRAVERLEREVTGSAAASYPSDLAFLRALKPIGRAVLYLREVEGASFEEIATDLGVTPHAARQIAVRARRTLDRVLKGDQ